MNIRSIKWRLITSYAILALLIVSAIALIANWAVQQYTAQQEVLYLKANAETIAERAFNLMWPVRSQNELEQLAQTAAFLGNLRVRILANRKVIADSGMPGGDQEYAWLILDPELGYLLGADNSLSDRVLRLGRKLPIVVLGDLTKLPDSVFDNWPPGTSLTVLRRGYSPWGTSLSIEVINTESESLQSDALLQEEQRSQRVVSAMIGNSGMTLGYVELSGSIDIGAQTLFTTRQAFLVAGIAAVLLAVLLGWIMGTRLSAPILKLADTTSAMRNGDLSLRADVDRNDEIGELASQFNHLAEKLQASFQEVQAERDALRRFIADASHELRNPITALKNFNDLLQGPAADDLEARTEFLAESSHQIERLSWITNNLLDLSRLDAGIASLDTHLVDLNDLLEGLSKEYQTIAIEKNIQIDIDIPEQPIQAWCDQERITIALANLIDNAIND